MATSLFFNAQIFSRLFGQPKLNMRAAFESTLQLHIFLLFFLLHCCSLLQKRGFTQTEIALIGTLCPTTAAEAKAIVPTLHDRDDPDLDDVLRELQSFKTFDTK
jgi:hypothetical protein